MLPAVCFQALADLISYDDRFFADGITQII